MASPEWPQQLQNKAKGMSLMVSGVSEFVIQAGGRRL